jgi:hypothetical protein
MTNFETLPIYANIEFDVIWHNLTISATVRAVVCSVDTLITT